MYFVLTRIHKKHKIVIKEKIETLSTLRTLRKELPSRRLVI